MQIIKNKNKFFLISFGLILIGIIIMLYNFFNNKQVFNYDIEFSGGTAFEININQDFINSDIENIVKQVTKQSAPQVQRVLNTNQVIIKIKSVNKNTRDELINKLAEKYSFDKEKSVRISDVSATISNEMQRVAIISVLLACLAILIYISFRFKNFKTGSCAVLALLHDASITILFYSVFRIPLNYSFIAVILTILGYSINATIVIFDRIRENKLKYKTKLELVDISVAQTMRRSVFTSLTTLLSIICLYILGVPSIKDFALPIIIGIICGTYSSVCIATSLWYIMNNKSHVA